ncbi:hypothetical protein QYM36_013718 [Artemia franciscana]|uniref:RNA exonuclease 4 n=1 Tax=Artemia franciscana TaxID=6661 RepID=A0AA88HF16_ARTSF|nr:hypothetical protein QYM36_013718 [Artemia franciscana]
MLSKKSENEKAIQKAKRGKKKFRSFAKKPTNDSETLETSKSCKTVISVPKKADQASVNWKNILNMIGQDKDVLTKTESLAKNKMRTKVNVSKSRNSQPTAKSALSTILQTGNPRTKSPESSSLEPTSKKRKIDNEESEEIWFDGVDEILLEASKEKAPAGKGVSLVKETAFKGLTKVVAMDCEMVGVGINDENVVARVSIVNHFGHCIYDKYVKPGERVTNFRTYVSGIRKEHLENAEEFSVVQQEVKEILRGRILVAHSVKNDLAVLYLKHRLKDIRDTAKYKGFVSLFDGRTPSLKNLTAKLLGINIQTGEHDSVS